MTTPASALGEVTAIASGGPPRLAAVRQAAGIRLRQHFIKREISLDDFVTRLVQVETARDVDAVNVAMRRLPPVPASGHPRDTRASRLAATDIETVARLFAEGDYSHRMPEGRWTAPDGIAAARWESLSIGQQAALRRAAEAARMTREAEDAEDVARIARVRACAVLHVTFGEPQAVRYRRYDITRSVYERALHATAADLPTFRSKRMAGRAADDAHAEYVRERSIKETARAIRDAAIVELGGPGRADRMRPSEIARAVGMSKQLVDAVLRQQVVPKAA